MQHACAVLSAGSFLQNELGMRADRFSKIASAFYVDFAKERF
jgi:hypothetical protein